MSRALEWLQRNRPASATTSSMPTTAAPTGDALALLQRLRERRPSSTTRNLHTDRTLPGQEIAPGLWRLDQDREWPRLPNRISAECAGLGDIDCARLRFFDSETTGLAGGTGTRAFMLGVARCTPEGIRLTQFTTSTLAAERSLLEAFLAELPGDSVLVSYNGKCYDRPLLSTRLRLARMADPLPAMPHLDLLHPTRRRLKSVLPNCRLATVEREWLGIVREDDLPGSEAPAAWLSYLRGGSAELLRRVGEHNAQDLVTLAALISRMRVGESGIAGSDEKAPAHSLV